MRRFTILAAAAAIVLAVITGARADDNANRVCNAMGKVAALAARDRNDGLSFRQSVRYLNHNWDAYVRDHRSDFPQYDDAEYHRMTKYLRDYIDRVVKAAFMNPRSPGSVLQDWAVGNCHRYFDGAQAQQTPPARNPDDPSPDFMNPAPEGKTADE